MDSEPVTSEALQRRNDRASMVAAHRREIWRYLRFLGCEAHLAEDLTHEVFLRAVGAPRHDDRGTAAQSAWLRTIARNIYRQHCRRPRPVDLDEAEAVWRQYCAQDGGEGYVDALRVCVAELPDRLRVALRLRYTDSASREVIATELGLAANGVKSLLRRGRELLRTCIERRLA